MLSAEYIFGALTLMKLHIKVLKLLCVLSVAFLRPIYLLPTSFSDMQHTYERKKKRKTFRVDGPRIRLQNDRRVPQYKKMLSFIKGLL